MKYCSACGTLLKPKFLKHEGNIPFCEQCKEYRFPISNTAVSMIVCNPELTQILMIQQYGKKDNILVAGYVNQKESLQEALMRECQEELGRKIVAYQYMTSEYFEASNTLICNFAVVLDQMSLEAVSDWEVDHAEWFSFDEALKQVKQASLAQRFLLYFMKQWNQGHISIQKTKE